MRSRRSLSFRPSLQSAALSLALVPLVTYVMIIAGLPFLSDFYFPGRVRAQVVGGLLLGGWLLWKWLARREFGRTSLDLPFCAVVAAVAVSALLSTDPRRSLEGVLDCVTYVLALYALLDLRCHARLWSGLLNAVLIVAGVVCLLALIQLAWWYGDQPPVVRQNPGLILQGVASLPRLSALGNPNILAVYLLLVLPLGVHRWLATRRWLARWLLGLGLLAAMLVFALTGSRGGLLGLGAACAAGAVIVVRQRVETRSIAWLGAAAGVVILGVAALVILSRGGLRLSGFTAEVRWESWRVAVQVLIERPLFGSGPRTFGAQLLQSGYLLSFGDVHSHAHSLYLTLAAEVGGLGLLALLWLVGSFAAELRAHWGAGGGFTVSTACALGLVGWAGHGLVDTFLDVPVVLVTVLLIAAGAMPPRRPARGGTRRARLLVASLAFLCLGGAGAWVDHAFAAHHEAREAALRGDWREAAAWLDTAVERDPAYRLYRQEEAFSHGLLACGDPSYLASAIARYGILLQSWADWPLDHANLAVLLARAGDIEGAIREADRAAKLAPTEPLYTCQLGALLEEAGRLDEAIQLYAICLAGEPAWLTSTFWYGAEWRAGARAAIIAQAESEALSRGGLLARASLRNYAGLFAEALEDASDYGGEHPGSARAEFEQARSLLGLGREDEALRLLDDVLERKPLDGASWMLRGQIRLRQGNLAEAAYDIENGAVLAAGPEALYWQGQLAEAQGDVAEAMSRYEAAVSEATRPEATQLAVSLAGRLPLPVEQLPCFVVLRPYRSFVAPALSLGGLLEQSGRCAEAADIYESVLLQEPEATEARERLDGLHCEANGG